LLKYIKEVTDKNFTNKMNFLKLRGK